MSSSASTPRSGDRVALDTSVAIDVLAAAVDVRLLSSVSEHLLPAPASHPPGIDAPDLRLGRHHSHMAVPQLFHRFAVARVTAALKDTPVVMVTGPRQCGKTTLVRDLVAGARSLIALWTTRLSWRGRARTPPPYAIRATRVDLGVRTA